VNVRCLDDIGVSNWEIEPVYGRQLD